MSPDEIEPKSFPAARRGVGPSLRGLFAACLAAGVLAGAAAATAMGERDRSLPAVSWTASEIVPGSPVVIEVRAAQDVRAAEAVAGSERFALAAGEDGVFRALVGIDLQWKGSSFPVDLELHGKLGEEPQRLRVDLFVKDKQFGRQALTLPAGMVDLSEEDAERVAKESALLRDVLARRTGALLWSGGFEQPLSGRVSTPFGAARSMNGQARAPHGGVDIAAPRGKPVKATADGVVAMTEEMFFSGRTVVLDHGSGVLTLYAHLDRVDVKVGEAVRRGDVLGSAGSTGRATGPHLHLAAYIRGARVDPLALVRALGPSAVPTAPQPALPTQPTS